jgi:hypothetical protein
VDLEEDQEKMMPYYEFECDKCGYIIERFYRVIPRIDPTQINYVQEGDLEELVSPL